VAPGTGPKEIVKQRVEFLVSADQGVSGDGELVAAEESTPLRASPQLSASESASARSAAPAVKARAELQRRQSPLPGPSFVFLTRADHRGDDRQQFVATPFVGVGVAHKPDLERAVAH